MNGIDYALLELQVTELMAAEENLIAAKGTAGEPEAKKELTEVIRRMNLHLENQSAQI